MSGRYVWAFPTAREAGVRSGESTRLPTMCARLHMCCCCGCCCCCSCSCCSCCCCCSCCSCSCSCCLVVVVLVVVVVVVVVIVFVSSVLAPDTPVFLSSQKPTFLNSNSIRNPICHRFVSQRAHQTV